ncbi:MAG: hypothetical protein HY657_05205 [Acidobacteria bacterium]|nr:hypothetical protein [Acidobacteriota bacterium]
MPAPDDRAQGEIRDLSRDLLNVARRDAQAPSELADDVRRNSARANAYPVIDELSRRTADALAGKTLSEETAQRLAQTLWVSVAARELSERQVEALQNDLHSLLVSTGVPEAQAEQVATQLGEVQRAVGERTRRWYELL